ncbi:MAG: SDR family oxidoreductase [Crocinitomicaceae bacterium]
MSKVLVTGASGAIGEVLVDFLKQENHEVFCIDSKDFRIENNNYFDELTNPAQIDVVYHLAGLANVPESWSNPTKFIQVNSLGTQRVLEFCRQHKAALNFVSSYVYGKPQYLPIDENHPKEALNPYALSKLLAEELTQFYGNHFELKFNIIRPFNVYGSIKNKKLLIPEIIDQIVKKNEVIVKDLTPKRDYVYLEDLAGFLLKCCTRFSNKSINVGSQTSHSVEEIVKLCIELWGNEKTRYVSENSERKNEIPETLSDNTFVSQFFDWSPSFTLKEGLEKMKKSM